MYVINAKVLAMERAVRTLTAQFYITARIVFVMKDSLAIHSVVAVKWFYVSKIFKYKKNNGNRLQIFSNNFHIRHDIVLISIVLMMFHNFMRIV